MQEVHSSLSAPTVPTDRPLRLVDGLLYLDRYWREEQLVRAELDARTSRTPLAVDTDRLRAALDRLFPSPSPDLQRLAVAACRYAVG